MIITSLQLGKRDRMRVNVYADGIFWAALEESTIAKHRIYQGAEILDENTAELLFEDAVIYVTRKLFDWYHMRPRSQREVRDKLSEKFTKLTLKNYEVGGNTVDRRKLMDQVLEKLSTYGDNSDETFARWFAAERVKQGKSGSRKIVSELMAKGVDGKLAQRVVAELSTDEKSLQTKLLLKKYGVESLNEIKDRDLKAKAYRFLISKGFTKINASSNED